MTPEKSHPFETIKKRRKRENNPSRYHPVPRWESSVAEKGKNIFAKMQYISCIISNILLGYSPAASINECGEHQKMQEKPKKAIAKPAFRVSLKGVPRKIAGIDTMKKTIAKPESVVAPERADALKPERAAPPGVPDVVVIPMNLLEKNPIAAAISVDDEDRLALLRNIENVGQRNPLTVREVITDLTGSGETRYEILDGCRRFDCLVNLGRENALCRIVNTKPENVKFGIYADNYARRKVSAGSRILAYIEMHETRGKRIDMIAGELSCNKRDVISAKAFLEAERENPDDTRFATVRLMIGGGMAISRWLPALEGLANKGEKRPGTDWARLCERSFTSLNGCFAHWFDIPPEIRGSRINELKQLLAIAPEEVRHVIRNSLTPPKKPGSKQSEE